MFFFTCTIMKTTSLFIIPLLTATSVSAHGYISQIVINGKVYVGNEPGANPVPSIIRGTNSINPIKGAHNPDVNCGNGAQPGALVADVNPGDHLSIKWFSGGNVGVRFHL